MAIKNPAVLAEWAKFRENLPPSTPYENLLGIAAEAKFVHHLRQKEIVPLPDGGLLATFEVLIGSETSPLELYDTVSMRMSGAPGPVSFAARVQLESTLIYLFFGRMPPAPPARVAEPEQTVDASEGEGDIKLDFDDTAAESTSEAEDRGFTPDAYEPTAPEPLDIIDHKEPDGVPIFKDLYSVGGPDLTADVVIAAVMEVIKPFSIRVSSKEELLALYTKNPDLNQFMIDFGTPEERLDLKTVLDRALARLSEKPREVRIPGGTGSAAPRRRVKA